MVKPDNLPPVSFILHIHHCGAQRWWFIEIYCNSFRLSTIHIMEAVTYWLAHKSISTISLELWKKNPPLSGGGIVKGMV